MGILDPETKLVLTLTLQTCHCTLADFDPSTSSPMIMNLADTLYQPEALGQGSKFAVTIIRMNRCLCRKANLPCTALCPCSRNCTNGS
ncbi:hypothetical protein PoB_002785900 [Plakobranchus ocellatus]|uniref:Uncharacterized protein n=1 Tax=Plakobranchus ocellatus TaxID=259542 RepID=A0AAV4A169_9GAST|nr:hypothetical protein PoB_002785900 [Plakobranchus ocellatus]